MKPATLIVSLRRIGLRLGFILTCAGYLTQPREAHCGPAIGPGQTPSGSWHYRLLEGSELVDDCPICARPAIVAPIRGSFDLRLLSENLLFSDYALENIDFASSASPDNEYRVVGSGHYRIGGEVALLQHLTLDVTIVHPRGTNHCFFTNETRTVSAWWPMIRLGAKQTNGTLVLEFTLQLNSAPLRDIWFSTRNGMTSGTLPPSQRTLTRSDLLSFDGHVVRHFLGMAKPLSFQTGADPGLDAVDVRPGSEIYFSINTTSTNFSRVIQHGDLLSDRGRIVLTNQHLLGAFAFMPPAPDVGLDALQVQDNGEIFFSIVTPMFSERLGVRLEAGDLLSHTGRIVRTSEQLLSRFSPSTASGLDPKTIGLDAVQLWPSGEIWFSTELGFQDTRLGPIGHGDLLSDQGYIVFRNLELVSAFAPLEDLADFGLDALYLVTDTVTPAPPPRFIRTQGFRNGVLLDWNGSGRVYQVYAAPAVTGPFTPLSQFLPSYTYFDEWFGLGQSGPVPPSRFYLLRQW